MASILRVEGSGFDVLTYLKSTGLKPSAVFRREQYPNLKRSAVHLALSNSDDSQQQIIDILSFLRGNAMALRELSNVKGVEIIVIDISIGVPGEVSPPIRLSKELIREAALFGLEFEISRFEKK